MGALVNFRCVPASCDAGCRGRPTDGLFRGAAPASFTPATLAALDAHGVVNIVDLRTSAERDASLLSSQLQGQRLRVHHLPVRSNGAHVAARRPTPEDYGAYYAAIVTAEGAQIANAVRLVAELGPGTACMCAAGKDRTGLVVAALLWRLGHSARCIASDYEASAAPLLESADVFRAHWEKRGHTREEYATRLRCDRASLRACLRLLPRGGVRKLALGFGLDATFDAKLGRAFGQKAA